MGDAAFEKVTTSDKPIYGPRKLMLCGFSSGAQSNFESVTPNTKTQTVRLTHRPEQGRRAICINSEIP